MLSVVLMAAIIPLSNLTVQGIERLNQKNQEAELLRWEQSLYPQAEAPKRFKMGEVYHYPNVKKERSSQGLRK